MHLGCTISPRAETFGDAASLVRLLFAFVCRVLSFPSVRALRRFGRRGLRLHRLRLRHTLLLPLGVLLLLLLLLLLLPLGVLPLPPLLLLLRALLLFLLLLRLGILLLFLLLLRLGILLLLPLLLLLRVLLLPPLLLLLRVLLLRLGILLLLLLLLPLRVLLLSLLLPRQWFSTHRRLNTLYPAHIHDANRCTRSRRTLAYLPDLGWRKRATGVLS